MTCVIQHIICHCNSTQAECMMKPSSCSSNQYTQTEWLTRIDHELNNLLLTTKTKKTIVLINSCGHK